MLLQGFSKEPLPQPDISLGGSEKVDCSSSSQAQNLCEGLYLILNLSVNFGFYYIFIYVLM